MFGLGYVDPALISDVLRRGGRPIGSPSSAENRAALGLRDVMAGPNSAQATSSNITSVATSSGLKPTARPNGPTLADIDAMLDDIALQMPLSLDTQYPNSQREADFWLRFDPDGAGFDRTFGSISNTWGPGQAGEGRLIPGYVLRDVRERAFEEARRQYPSESQHNNLGDVFRHAYASGLLTRFFGERDAKLLMDAYERSHPNPPAERYGDLFTNWFARTVEGHPGLTDLERISLIRRAIERGLVPPSGQLPVR